MDSDTIHLLGDCTAGITRTVSTIDHLLPVIKDRSLRQRLQTSRDDHQHLHQYACRLLDQYGGQEKRPGSLARNADRLRAMTHMAIRGDDMTAAGLICGSCDAGVRTLSRSSNRYCMADPDAIHLTQELIRCEEGLSATLRPYL